MAQEYATVQLGIIDLENLTVNLKPKAPEPGQKPAGLGTTEAPFGDLYLQGNTLTLSTKSIGITEQDGAEYLDFGSNTIIGATTISGDRLLAFADQLSNTYHKSHSHWLLSTELCQYASISIVTS